jgi:hypothetical protein
VAKSTVVSMPSHMVTSVTLPANASRGLKVSPLQRISEIVLVVGIMAAAAAAAGPLWVVRLGVAAAILAALTACAFAWREINSARHAHAQAMLRVSRDHGVTLTEERRRNASVVDTLQLRISDAGKVIERQRRRIAEQRLQLSDLKTDQAYLKGEVEYREKVITALRETVRERETELSELGDGVDAEVHHMPRRMQGEHESVWDELSAVEEISGESDRVEDDLAIIDMVLPNYEADRQPA